MVSAKTLNWFPNFSFTNALCDIHYGRRHKGQDMKKTKFVQKNDSLRSLMVTWQIVQKKKTKTNLSSNY